MRHCLVLDDDSLEWPRTTKEAPETIRCESRRHRQRDLLPVVGPLASAGGKFPIGPGSRLRLNQSTESSMASYISCRVFHELPWITPALYNPLTVSVSALS